jgi:hypothetical protein
LLAFQELQWLAFWKIIIASILHARILNGEPSIVQILLKTRVHIYTTKYTTRLFTHVWPAHICSEAVVHILQKLIWQPARKAASHLLQGTGVWALGAECESNMKGVTETAEDPVPPDATVSPSSRALNSVMNESS